MKQVLHLSQRKSKLLFLHLHRKGQAVFAMIADNGKFSLYFFPFPHVFAVETIRNLFIVSHKLRGQTFHAVVRCIDKPFCKASLTGINPEASFLCFALFDGQFDICA